LKRGRYRAIAALVVCAALLAGPLLAALPATADAPTPLYTSQPSPTPVYANVTGAAGVWGNLSIYNSTDLQRELSRGLLNGGRGACVADFDNDGLDDIYVVGPGENQMFRNLGNFSFSDVSAAAGVAHRAYGMGCTQQRGVHVHGCHLELSNRRPQRADGGRAGRLRQRRTARRVPAALPAHQR
jgi:hypothetical protein